MYIFVLFDYFYQIISKSLSVFEDKTENVLYKRKLKLINIFKKYDIKQWRK